MSDQLIFEYPIAGALGAEINGIDLTKKLSNSQSQAIKHALLKHKVIIFRDQNISPEDHLRIAGIYGDIYRVPFVKGRVDYPDIIDIIKEPEDGTNYNFGGVWHSDATFDEYPPKASALFCLESPPFGGDTLFVNMEAAYEGLSDAMKELLDGVWALHSAERNYGSSGYFSDEDQKSISMNIETSNQGDLATEHPVIRTHPETGQKGLFINPIYTTRFKDMTVEESQPILDFLYSHATRPEFQCRINWTSHALAIWDNRCTMHFAINDYSGHRRHMNRVTIAGDRPV